MFHTPNLPILGLAAAVALAIFGTAAQGEIANRGKAKTKASTPISSAIRLAPDTPLKVECWQEGRKIITEDGIYGFTVKSLIESTSVSFRRKPGSTADLFIVSLKHSTCLIRAAPGTDE